MHAPMSDGEYDPTADELLDRRHDAVDLRRGSNHTHPDRVLRVPGHEPVLALGEVLPAVDVLERLDLLLGGDEELRGVRAALRELDEGALGVPAEECRGVGRAVGAQEVQELRVEGAFLGLRASMVNGESL